MATRKAASRRGSTSPRKPRPTGRRPPRQDPEGGLTAEGRKAFARKEDSNLRPGVKGPADTPEKMRRKGIISAPELHSSSRSHAGQRAAYASCPLSPRMGWAGA